MDFGKFFKKGSLAAIVVSVLCLIVLFVGVFAIINSGKEKPTDEQKKQSEELKKKLEEKKQDKPVDIPPNATNEQKEQLQYKQFKQTLENILNPVHLSRFTGYEHEILSIKSIDKNGLNTFFVKAEVVWTDGEYYVSRDVLYNVHIKVYPDEFNQMSLEDLNNYLTSNKEYSAKEYRIIEPENELDKEFLQLLVNQFKEDKSMNNAEYIDGVVLYQGKINDSHSNYFFFALRDAESQKNFYYKLIVDLDSKSFENQLEQLRQGEKIEYMIDESFKGEYGWLNLDKLEGQSQQESQ